MTPRKQPLIGAAQGARQRFDGSRNLSRQKLERIGHSAAAYRTALKLRSQCKPAHRGPIVLARLIGRTTGILPYVRAPVSFKPLLGRKRRRALLSNQNLFALGLADRLVGKEGEVARDGLVADEAHGFLVVGLGEKALAHPQYDRVDHQSQLVDEIVVEQCVHELEAAGDDDVAGYVLFQSRNLTHHVALEHRRVAPRGMLNGRGDDVLGLAVQPVRQGASPGWPPRSQELVGASTQQHGLGSQRLVERDLGYFFTAPFADTPDPTAMPEALVTGRGLDDAIERCVFADDDPSHFGSPLVAAVG